MQKKKIVILTTAHPAYDVRVFYREAVSLAKNGYEVTLIVTADAEETKSGVHIIPLKKIPSRLKRMLVKPWSALRQALKIPADVYYLHDPELLFIGLVLRMRGKKVVYDAHEDLPRQIMAKEYIPRALRRPISWLADKYVQFAVRRLSGLVIAWPNMLERFKGYKKPLAVVNNYPLLSEFPEPAPYENREKAIFYVGAVTKVRGLLELIETGRLSGAKVYIGGTPAPASFLDEMKAQPGWDNVQFEGQMNRAQIVETLSKVAVGMSVLLPTPNHIAALPTKMFEYMAAAVPVVVSDFPGWKAIVDESRCGFAVDATRPEEAAKAVEALLADEDEARAMGERGRRAVVEKYNWEKEVENQFRLLEEVIGE